MILVPHYQVDELLYESANSQIYRGTRLRDGMRVIFKALVQVIPSQESRVRFQQEYNLMCKLQSHSLPTPCGMESVEQTQVMVLEDSGGISLNNLNICASLPIAEWLKLAIGIVECIDQLHRKQVIHKDINPSNIIWNRASGRVTLIDLGIASELSREVPELRNPEYLEGTLAYLSPEQTGRMNRAIDYRTDFYSLGVTFYELLTGRLPFPVDDVLEAVHAHLAKVANPIDQINPAIPGMLSAIVAKLMAKTAEARYQSAAGLKTDLQACLESLDSVGHIPAFTLGRNDFSGRLQISQKLYGREKQIDTLLAAFQRASTGPAELLLIAGYSGVGKSALVHEIEKPIARNRGYFTEGKFDQFNRDIPYSALIHAFSALMRRLLRENDAVATVWKDRLLNALGTNGQVIIDVIPDLELIIGPQAATTTLPAAHAQNRFNHEFRQFVGALTSREHPLALFIDDLQWADLPSLQLIALLLDSAASSHFLIIGAYRDNEITPTHPLTMTLTDLEKTGATLQTVTLAPLTQAEVRQLLCESLHVNDAQVDPLAGLCMEKTQGNPFFLNQFIGALVDQEMLFADEQNGRWQWDFNRIKEADITSNVVDLMVAKLQRQTLPTQRVLQAAACLGNVFDLKTLSIVCHMSDTDTVQLLWDALTEELIVPLNEHYRYAGQGPDGIESSLVLYRFLHDRVHQAAYLLSDASEKAAMHLAIGRLWLSLYSEAEKKSALFELVNHLNLGRALITDSSERHQLAQMNLAAGHRAKASAAFKPALIYFQIGLELVGNGDWEQHYAFLLELHLEAAEAAYLSADIPQMKRCIDIVLKNARTLLDQVKAHEIGIQALISEDNFHQAVLRGVEVLDLLGISFPKKPTQFHILLSLAQTKLALAGKDIGKLDQMPEMTNPDMIAATNILAKIGSAAHSAIPNYVPLFLLTVIRLSLKHGNSQASAFMYSAYAMILAGVLGNVDQAVRFADMAIRLQDRPGMADYKCRTTQVVHAVVMPWKVPLKNCIEPLRRNYLLGVETGDLEFASNAAIASTLVLFYSGAELSGLDQDIANYSRALAHMQRPSSHHFVDLVWQVVHNLTGQAPDPHVLRGKIYDENKMKVLESTSTDQRVMYNLFGFRLMLCYLFHDYPRAIENARQTVKYHEGTIAFFTQSRVCFYDALACAASLPAATGMGRKELMRNIRLNQKKLAKWASDCPENFVHMVYLVQAEVARHTGKPFSAIDTYEQAIRLAEKNNFIMDSALAKELAGEFYLQRGQEIIAMAYIRAAQNDYRRWGASAKVEDLSRRYPQRMQEAGLSPHSSEFSTRAITASKQGEKPISGTSLSGALDFATAMKASQALSQEIRLEGLLKRLMQVALENAGAQRGLLLLKNENQWFLEAEKTDDQAETSVLQSVLLDESDQSNARLPLSLLHYVNHTRESVVIREAMREEMVANDPYVLQHQPLSLLAVPILHHQEIMGVLYLENNAVAGAFTEQRLEVLHLLASQAAISIENSRLYADMEQRIAARTAELKAMSLRDALTGVANRKAFNERMAEEMARMLRNGQPLALLLLDIDHFKSVNDSYGHLVGDECLARVGAALAGTRRVNDFVARYGGEEFTILLPNTDLAGATLCAERALDAVRGIVLEIGVIRHPITASIGVALAQPDAIIDATSLIACADQRMYDAKFGGRNRIVNVDRTEPLTV